MTRNVWLRLGRVSNLPTVWSNVLTASVLSHARPPLISVCILLLSMSAMYVGGMYLNDAFDREIDAKERPQRPIPSGAVSARTVFAIGFTLLALGILATGVATTLGDSGRPAWALLSSVALAGVIVAYDVYHKQNPLSPLLMAACRVLVYVTTAFAVGGNVNTLLLCAAFGLLSHLIGLTYVAKQESRASLRGLWPLAFLSVTPVWGAFSVHTPGQAALCALLLLWVIYSLSWLFRKQGRSIPAGVVRMIAGISLVDAVFAGVGGFVEVAVVCVVCCGLTRIAQRVIPGT